jgi:hypothetical protein
MVQSKPRPWGVTAATLPRWQRWVMHLGAPLRRIYFRPWFALVGGVGAAGSGEEYLDVYGAGNVYFGETGRVPRKGELFLYVNDALLPLPWLGDLFYRNNTGTALIIISRRR